MKIEDVDLTAFKSDLEKDQDGRYLYNVTNDIFLPFEESELDSLILNTRKVIKYKVKYSYSFRDDKSGIAVIFKKAH